MPTIPEYDVSLRVALESIGAAQRAELLHTLELADFQRAEHIGMLCSPPATRSLAELAIDAQEDRLVRALLIGMLKERQRGGWRRDDRDARVGACVEAARIP